MKFKLIVVGKILDKNYRNLISTYIYRIKNLVGLEIIEINQELDDSPELLNGDPYGEGWIFILKLSETTSTESLLSAKDYRELVEG